MASVPVGGMMVGAWCAGLSISDMAVFSCLDDGYLMIHITREVQHAVR